MSTLVSINLRDVAVFGALQSVGQKLLLLGFVAWLVVETYKLITRGQCDYLTPCVRVATGALLLTSLPQIHAVIASDMQGAASTLGDDNLKAMFTAAYQHALGDSAAATGSAGVMDAMAMLANVFSLQGLMALGSVGLALGMMVTKILVLDILWPLCLGLVVVFGALAIPLGVLPGLGTLKGWVKNLLEVALWPIVFQAIVSLMVASFARYLSAMKNLDFGQVLTDPTAPAQDFLLLMRWWAFCLAYLFMTLMTPLFASMVVRSTPVGIVGGIVAAQIVKLGASAVGGIAGAGLGKFVSGAMGGMARAGAGGLGQSGLATANAAMQPIMQAKGGQGSSPLDRRTHRSSAEGDTK